MENEVLVFLDLQRTPHRVGRLWMRTRKDRESATFEYDQNWLAHPERFSLEPALKLGPGPFHTGPSSRSLPLWSDRRLGSRPRRPICYRQVSERGR